MSSNLGFIDFIVDPSMVVLGELLDRITTNFPALETSEKAAIENKRPEVIPEDGSTSDTSRPTSGKIIK